MPRNPVLLLAAVLIGVLSLTSGCGTELGAGTAGARCPQSGSASSAVAQGNGITVSPTVVAPGDRFAVKFPERRQRTDTLFLHGADPDNCSLSYMLYQGHYWKKLGANETLNNLASLDWLRTVHGTVPTNADPGKYTVCDLEESACARLTVHS